MKIPPHLSMYNLAEDHLPTFVQALQDWSDALAEFIVANLHPDDGTYLREAAISAFERSGVRCMAVEILDEYCRLENWPSVLNEIHTAAYCVGDPKRLVAPINEIRTLARNAEFCLLFVSADSMQSPPRRHKMTWRTWPGKILYFNAPVILNPPQASTIQPAVAPSEIFAKGTKSQRQAIRELAELIHVKRAGLSLGGITPRTTALLVGMSGSGKTWAANAVATMAKLPCFECTIGSWTINGGRSDVPSNETLRRHLRENGPSVILVDEVDKLRRRDDNANYLAFVFDEVMSVIDAASSSSTWIICCHPREVGDWARPRTMGPPRASHRCKAHGGPQGGAPEVVLLLGM